MAEATITITFPDGSNREYPAGVTAADIAKGISSKLGKKALAVMVGDTIRDLHTPLRESTSVRILTRQDPESITVLRHSAAHVMADAVQRLFPGTRVAIGPAIDTGFYYDFDRDTPFTTEDLAVIEKKMMEIIKENLAFERQEVTRQQARELFAGLGEDYKLELLDAIKEGEAVSLYRHGEWTDLCRGPHLPSTAKIPSIKLTAVAGAYWRGDERNKMLHRIYGTAFWDKQDLQAHLEMIEEAKRRDHRRLGKDMDLFSIDETIGGGLVLWHPRGAMVRNMIEEFWRHAHLANGYDLVGSPHIARDSLWERSGHLEWYSEDMYAGMDVDGQNYLVKPMNCPFHMVIYKSRLRSYRELPLRWAELGTVYRYERSGVLHGLLRVRGFTQDDAHLFMTEAQLDSELDSLIEFNLKMLAAFGFTDYNIYFSTRPEKFVGNEALWERAEQAIQTALERAGLQYDMDQGGGAFYGPKIDIKLRDSLGRQWQCSTIQVDFALPERFDLKYVGEDGARHRPIMIHRALLGSIERFFAMLLEHYAGNFPVWLAPEQARVLTVTDTHLEWGGEVQARLRKAGVRVGFDDRSVKLGAKIRLGETEKVPFMMVIGAREIEQGGVTIRGHGGLDQGFMSLDQAVAFMLKGAAMPELRMDGPG